MESDSFICSLRRFFAVRGVLEILQLRCDQGANFICAKSKLDKAMKELDDNLSVVNSRLKSFNGYLIHPTRLILVASGSANMAQLGES